MAAPSPSPSPSVPPANQFNRIRPKKPLDVWSTREKLCLASAVYKIGDQNWVSVSRAIKPYAEPNRPPDWFHQKNCVLQYYDMLEQLEQPKRKRGDRAETDTPSLQIMRKMTIERSEQLKKEVMEMQQEFKQLKSEAESVDAGLWDDRLEDEWAKIKVEQKMKEEDVKVEVIDTDQEDMNESAQGLGGEMDESTQDSVGENVDISMLIDEEESQTTKLATGSHASTSLDVTGKLPASSHLLSSLLQSNMKTANELQQLKMEQEQENVQQLQTGSSVVVSSLQQSLLKTPNSLDPQSTSVSTDTVSMTDIKPDLEDSHVDVMTEVVEETVVEEVDITSHVTVVAEKPEEPEVIPKDEENMNSNCAIVDVVEEEVIELQETVVKTEDETEEIVVEEDPKDSTAELDVEGLDVKDEPDKDSQDEEENVLKQISESIMSGAEAELVDTSLKIEPLSPTSSISSRISESGSKRGRRGRPKSARSRVSGRKSYTDDERKEDVNSSRFSDVELSEEDMRDADDLLPGALAASSTGSILSESFPNSPASLSICSDTEEEKSYKQWKKSIMLVWRAAATHKYANVFLHPVTDDIAPGYNSVVLRPMDLSTIKKNVELGAIRATVEFQRDLMLMFSNAIMYNSSDHNVYKMATEMYDDVMQHIEIMVQTSDAKNLRQSRRPDASDKEDDSKKRRLSVDQSEGGKTKKRKTRLEEPV